MKVFDKIFDAISSLNNNIIHLIDCYKREHDDVIRAYNSYGNIIQEQDRIIQSLLKSQTNNKDMECMVFVPVIKEEESGVYDLEDFVKWDYKNRE